MRGFLGITGYYREFVRGYAGIARPLYNLLKENSPWIWGDAENTAFTVLKERLACSPILALPEEDRPFTVYSDFCGHSISAVLEQVQADGRSHVISYASRTCSEREHVLGSTEGELLALLYAVTKFHRFIAGTPFTVVVDNAAL